MLAREIGFLGTVGTTSLSGGNCSTSSLGHGVVQDLEPLLAQIDRFLASIVVQTRVVLDEDSSLAVIVAMAGKSNQKIRSRDPTPTCTRRRSAICPEDIAAASIMPTPRLWNCG
jgi:hypothetical protein